MIRADVPEGRVDVVRGNLIFAGLPAKELTALAAARDTSYRAREYVFSEGEPAVAFCIVKRGGRSSGTRRAARTSS